MIKGGSIRGVSMLVESALCICIRHYRYVPIIINHRDQRTQFTVYNLETILVLLYNIQNRSVRMYNQKGAKIYIYHS